MRARAQASASTRLGFDASARVLVVHADDLGLCDSANRGGVRALDSGATSGSVMVPCAAFDDLAARARADRRLDLGVHLTLTAEWPALRWRPLRDDVASLCAADGAMYPDVARLLAAAPRLDEVERELRAQVDRALAAGIDVTHLDSHMFALFSRELFGVLAAVARAYRLPLLTLTPAAWAAQAWAGFDRDALATAQALIDDGFVAFDSLLWGELHQPAADVAAAYERMLDELPPGVHCLLAHPAIGGDDLRTIADDWRVREAEYRLFDSGAFSRALGQRGIHALSMRALRTQLREE